MELPHPIRRVLWRFTVLCIASVASAQTAGAGDLYLSGNLGIGGGVGESGGTTLFFTNSGDDSDSSPLYGGSLGLVFPMAELVPADWDIRPPPVEMRLEFEAIGGHDYELTTDGGDPYHTDVYFWSVMHNVWFDLPIQSVLSRWTGRLPLVEPLSIYAGAGVGLGSLDVSTTNNVFEGSDQSYGFVWQVGGGLAYALTEHVRFSIGYRYLDMGEADFTLYDPPNPDPVGGFSMDMSSHQVMTALRVDFYPVPFPARWRFD